MIDFYEAMRWCKAEEEDAAEIEALCFAATEIVQRETGLYLGTSDTVTEVIAVRLPVQLRGVPSGPLVLSEEDGSSWSVVDTANYHVDGDILRPASGWTQPAGRLRAVYTTGYAAGSVPRDLQIAGAGLVAHMFENRGDGQANTGNYDKVGVPDWIQQVFRLHRRVAV